MQGSIPYPARSALSLADGQVRTLNIFTESVPLGGFSHTVAMSVVLCVSLSA